MNHLITIGIYFLEGLFALGLFGCLFVLVLATIDDIKVLVHHEPKSAPSSAQESHEHGSVFAHAVPHPQAH